MLKLLIPIVVAGTLTGPGAPSASTPAAQPAAAGTVLPLLGFNVCVGAVDPAAKCHVRLPDPKTPAATTARPAQSTWFTLLGKTVCLGEPQGRTCDLRLPLSQGGARQGS